MAKKVETIIETVEDLGTPVKRAMLYETVGAAGFPTMKTLQAGPELQGIKMWRTKDATLLIKWRGETHEIRNYKLLSFV